MGRIGTMVVCGSLVAALGGCATTPWMSTTRTVPEGAQETGVALGADVTTETREFVALPVTVWTRWGVGPATDVGLRFWSAGASGDFRHRLVRAGRFEVAFGGSLGLAVLGGLACDHIDCIGPVPALALAAEAPLLFGLDLGSVRLAAGPRVGYMTATSPFITAQGSSDYVDQAALLYGGTVASEFQLGDGWLVLDFSLTGSPQGAAGVWGRFSIGLTL